MKRIIPILLLVLLLAGCSVPDSLQLELYHGYGRQLKLVHLNAATSQKRELIERFETIQQDAVLLDKDISLFAYYPDYLLEITRKGRKTALIVDINGDFVDFHYAGETALYRAAMSSQELKKLIFQYY